MSADPNKLGIFVTSPQHMRHVLGIARAAVRVGMEVKAFFTFRGVHLTKCPGFAELAGLLKVENLIICAASYQCEGYDVEDVPQGITERQMGTQANHGPLLEECGKYVTL